MKCLVNAVLRRCVAVVSVLALACVVSLSGCSSEEDTYALDESAAVDLSQLDLTFTDRDQDASWDESEATTIVLADGTEVSGPNASAVSTEGQEITISAAGTYVLSGQLSDGQVRVAVDEADKVQLVLDGVTIHNEDGPAIRIDEGDKAFITLAEGSENALSDGTTYELDEGSDEPYATLYSKIDLTLNGTGALSVQGAYRHAICSKDDLVVTGGAYELTSVEDALRGRDCVKVAGGTFAIDAGEDAVKSNNDEDATRGYVLIDGGTFTVRAGDDAFHAETAFLMRGGEVTVSSCYEGFEGRLVQIEGGVADITATDDGINAATSSTDVTAGEATDGNDVPGAAGGQATADDRTGTPPNQGGGTTPGQADASCQVKISGGQIRIDATADGIDSNGNVEISGGTIIVDGPLSDGEGAFDYDGTATVSGGTVLMAGSTGMAQSFSEGTQAFALVEAAGSAGDTVTIATQSGEVIASYTAAKDFACVVMSTPALSEGETYQLVIGGTVAGGSTAWGVTSGGAITGGSSHEFTASTEGTSGGGLAGGGSPGGGPDADGGTAPSDSSDVAPPDDGGSTRSPGSASQGTRSTEPQPPQWSGTEESV